MWLSLDEGKETYRSHRGKKEILDAKLLSSIAPGTRYGEIASWSVRRLSQTILSMLNEANVNDYLSLGS